MASNDQRPPTPDSPPPPCGMNCLINGVRYLYGALTRNNNVGPSPRGIAPAPQMDYTEAQPIMPRPMTMSDYATAGPLDFPWANSQTAAARPGPSGDVCFPDVSFEWRPPNSYVPVTPENPPVTLTEPVLKEEVPEWIKRPNKIFKLAGSGKRIEKIVHTEVFRGFRVLYVNLSKPHEYLPDIQIVRAWEAYQLFPDIVRNFFESEKKAARDRTVETRVQGQQQQRQTIPTLPHFQQTCFPIHAERIRSSVDTYEREFPNHRDLTTMEF